MFLSVKGGQIEKGAAGLVGKKLGDLAGSKKFTKHDKNGKTVQKNQDDSDYLKRNYDHEWKQGERQFGGVWGKQQAEQEATKLTEITGVRHEVRQEGEHSMPNYHGEHKSENGKYGLYRAYAVNEEKTNAPIEGRAGGGKPKTQPRTLLEERDKNDPHGTIRRGIYQDTDGSFLALTSTQSKSFKTEKGAKDWMEKVSGKPVDIEKERKKNPKIAESAKEKRRIKGEIVTLNRDADMLESAAKKREGYSHFKDSESLQAEAKKLRGAAEAKRNQANTLEQQPAPVVQAETQEPQTPASSSIASNNLTNGENGSTLSSTSQPETATGEAKMSTVIPDLNVNLGTIVNQPATSITKEIAQPVQAQKQKTEKQLAAIEAKRKENEDKKQQHAQNLEKRNAVVANILEQDRRTKGTTGSQGRRLSNSEMNFLKSVNSADKLSEKQASWLTDISRKFNATYYAPDSLVKKASVKKPSVKHHEDEPDMPTQRADGSWYDAETGLDITNPKYMKSYL